MRRVTNADIAQHGADPEPAESICKRASSVQQGMSVGNKRAIHSQERVEMFTFLLLLSNSQLLQGGAF